VRLSGGCQGWTQIAYVVRAAVVTTSLRTVTLQVFAENGRDATTWNPEGRSKPPLNTIFVPGQVTSKVLCTPTGHENTGEVLAVCS
jgi:hypothetical protein